MTGSYPENPEDRETRINALLDGELDEASGAALKAAAEEDRVLARALLEAWQLHRRLDELQLERAPASLRRKLDRIPFEQQTSGQRPVFGMPRWALAGALEVVATLFVGLVLVQQLTQPGSLPQASLPPPGAERAPLLPESDSARVDQTRRELKIAFHYLDKAGFRVGRQIDEVLHDELSAPIKENLSRIIPNSGQSPKEKNV